MCFNIDFEFIKTTMADIGEEQEEVEFEPLEAPIETPAPAPAPVEQPEEVPA
jgi:hypothetical protein